MLLKRIQESTLEAALARVQEECGEDALIVETRRSAKGVLVIAAKPESLDSGPTAPASPAPRAKSWSQLGWTRGFAPLAECAESFGISQRLLKAVEKALLGTRIELSRAGAPALPGIATRVLKALLPTSDPLVPNHKVIAMVGPTGVGKTTTLAKLAAQATRDRGESIAIVTIDTYRVAAVEQLRAFAEVLHAPFEVAFTPADLRRAVKTHAHADRIFIDTTGRSPFDGESIDILRGTLEGCDPTTLLCMAAGSRRIDAEAILGGFDAVQADAAILTKWDETQCPGETISLLAERGIPTSHVTIGQDVPDDIVAACSATLAAAAFQLPEEEAQRVLAAT